MKESIFAGGCFWCMEPVFDAIPGVTETVVGYSGGKEEDPSYDDVASGKTGHAEAVLVRYDPSKVQYEKLLDEFWKNIDPTQSDGQFADRGRQYRTGIFYFDDEQRKLAEESKKKLQESGKFSKLIVTEISPATEFYRAEAYHQEYYKSNAVRYKLYKEGSGRAGFIRKMWGEEK